MLIPVMNTVILYATVTLSVDHTTLQF